MKLAMDLHTDSDKDPTRKKDKIWSRGPYFKYLFQNTSDCSPPPYTPTYYPFRFHREKPGFVHNTFDKKAVSNYKAGILLYNRDTHTLFWTCNHDFNNITLPKGSHEHDYSSIFTVTKESPPNVHQIDVSHVHPLALSGDSESKWGKIQTDFVSHTFPSVDSKECLTTTMPSVPWTEFLHHHAYHEHVKPYIASIVHLRNSMAQQSYESKEIAIDQYLRKVGQTIDNTCLFMSYKRSLLETAIHECAEELHVPERIVKEGIERAHGKRLQIFHHNHKGKDCVVFYVCEIDNTIAAQFRPSVHANAIQMLQNDTLPWMSDIALQYVIDETQFFVESPFGFWSTEEQLVTYLKSHPKSVSWLFRSESCIRNIYSFVRSS